MDQIGLSGGFPIALDAESRPLEAFVRVLQVDAVRGSTPFVVEPPAIVSEGVTLDHGPVSQRKPLATPCPVSACSA